MARKAKPLSTSSTIEKQQLERISWYPVFLEQLRNSANVRLSCQAANIDRKTAYNYRHSDPEFAAAWDESLIDATEALEAVAWRRATQKTDPSDTLLIFLLKAHRPDKYRERFDVNMNLDFSKLTDEELKRLAEGGKL